MMEPLNGTQTHELSPMALAALGSLAQGPSPRQTFNPGIVNRLEREAFVEEYDMPNPYKTKAKTVRGLRITEAGRQRLQQARPAGRW